MRRELLTFSVHPPVAAVQADPEVSRLVTLLIGAGGTVDGIFVDEAGTELALVVELDDDAPPPDTDALRPRLQLLSRRVHEQAPRPTPPVPRLVEPDPTLVDPHPVPWQSLEIEPDGTALVSFTRGIVERLHSVEVADDRITVRLGRVPGAWAGPVPAVGIVERTRIRVPPRLQSFIAG